jgi:predicted RNA-binding Zn-ribbon protein involved in translation (DUF1610 family)
MIVDAHELLSEADAVCHYNGASFDIPRLNAEFLKMGLPPTPKIPQIDLKTVVMNKFGFVSSKLAFIGPELEIGEKVKNSGWDLWRGCLNGDPKCWKEMETYNKQDVKLLERLYNKLLPWIDNHPNMNLFVEGENPVCPNCGGSKLTRRGIERATTYMYRRILCNDCGKWSRERIRDKNSKVASVR